MSSGRKRPTVRRVSRDGILFIAGLAGIGWQQYTERVVWPLLVVYGVMVGLPGAQALLALLPGREPPEELEDGDRPTTGPPSRSPSHSSPR